MIPPTGANPGAQAPAGDHSGHSQGRGPEPRIADAPARRARIALAHDWLVGYRGGEAVLEAIARLVVERHTLSRIYTMFDNGVPLAPTIDASARRASWLSSLPGATGRLRRWLLPLYPAAVGQLSRVLALDHAREPIDLVISTSSAAIKGLKAPSGVPHLCYCHAPARYLWSQRDQYALGSGGRARSLGLRLLGGRLRAWDRRTSANVDLFLANSTHIAGQIRACFGREARVIHPPVRTNYFTPDPSTPRSGAWLYVGALEPYKRVDVAIHAANRARAALTIVGTGTQLSALRSIAGPRVRFLGRVSDQELRDYYRRAAALLFPQTEDFGIVAVEAQACGTPVVAFGSGGALDSVIPGKTGVFFDRPAPEALIEAVRRAQSLRNPAEACRSNAEHFSEAAFATAMQRVIDECLSGRAA